MFTEGSSVCTVSLDSPARGHLHMGGRRFMLISLGIGARADEDTDALLQLCLPAFGVPGMAQLQGHWFSDAHSVPSFFMMVQLRSGGATLSPQCHTALWGFSSSSELQKNPMLEKKEIVGRCIHVFCWQQTGLGLSNSSLL